jgi:hypothetical protein
MYTAMTIPFDRNAFNAAIDAGRVFWRKHVLLRLLERGISQSEVLQCAYAGDCIQTYPDDTPFPCALFFAVIESEPLHVVASFDEAGEKSVHYNCL